MDGLTDITVSSVHTSDLSSFEEDTEEEVVMSDSMEEGEITSDGNALSQCLCNVSVKHYLCSVLVWLLLNRVWHNKNLLPCDCKIGLCLSCRIVCLISLVQVTVKLCSP